MKSKIDELNRKRKQTIMYCVIVLRLYSVTHSRFFLCSKVGKCISTYIYVRTRIRAASNSRCQMSTEGTKRRKREDRQTNELRYTHSSVTKTKKESKRRRRRITREEKESGAVRSAGWRAVKSNFSFLRQRERERREEKRGRVFRPHIHVYNNQQRPPC